MADALRYTQTSLRPIIQGKKHLRVIDPNTILRTVKWKHILLFLDIMAGIQPAMMSKNSRSRGNYSSSCNEKRFKLKDVTVDLNGLYI